MLLLASSNFFLLLFAILVPFSDSSKAFLSKVRDHESLDTILSHGAQFSSFPPPPLQSSSQETILNQELKKGSCSCKQILVSSLGEGQHIQHDSMGTYKYYQMYNGYPSYFGPSGRRLYFVSSSGWLIGPTLGGPTGYIHNGNHYQCPYLIPKGWMFVNSGYWYNDDTLVVRCIA